MIKTEETEGKNISKKPLLPFIAKFKVSAGDVIVLFYKTRENEPGFSKDDLLGIVLKSDNLDYNVGRYDFYETLTIITRDESHYEILEGSVVIKNDL